MQKNKSFEKILLPLSFAIALIFDFLFWKKVPGISFTVIVVLSLGVGFWLARRNGATIPRQSVWLLLPIAFFIVMSTLRLEAFSAFLSHALTLILMAVLAANLLGGRWLEYSLTDYLARISGLPFLGLASYRQLRNERKEEGEERGIRKRSGPIGRGLLLAAPLLLVLGSLLASADYVFAEWLANIFAFLRIENVAEYLWRGFYIVVLGYLLTGVYSYALMRSQDKKLIGEDKAIVKPFIGFTEAATMLVSVQLLFAVFVGIQLRYLFGGTSNINLGEYSYAEYARRGFGELVVVAVISVSLFVALSLVSQRKKKSEKQWFSRLGISLFLLVAVILGSAFQRLTLYESVYGFTRTRTNVHAFILWLDIFLIALVVLEATGRRRAFTLAMALSVLGFAASINLLNVDGFIVSANAQRLDESDELDIAYLASLSEDAVAPLIAEIEEREARGQDAGAERLLAALACHAYRQEEYKAREDWQSFTLSRWRAEREWAEFRRGDYYKRVDLLVVDGEDELRVVVEGEDFVCFTFGEWD